MSNWEIEAKPCKSCNWLFVADTCALCLLDQVEASKKQSKIDSFMEALTNTMIGFWVAVAANFAILPLFGYTPSFGDSTLIALLFTIVSIVRSYIIRRLFNGRSVWATIRSKF